MVNLRRERIDILNDITQLRVQISGLQLQEEKLLNELRGTIEDPVAKLFKERENIDCGKLYNYIREHYKWRIESVVHAEDKGRSIQFINFYNEETKETISFDPMTNLNKFANFVSTHGIASSNVYHVTPARAIEVAARLNVSGARWRLPITNNLMLLNLGDMGFIALVNKSVTTTQYTNEVLPIFNINYHGVRKTLVNFHFINSMSETTMHVAHMRTEFNTPLDMVNYLKTYLPKRSTNVLLNGISVNVNGTFYTYKYVGKTGRIQALYMLSLENDIGYHGYHTWMLTRNEFLTFKAMVRGHTRIKDVIVNTIESK